jgi:hypothetical protein
MSNKQPIADAKAAASNHLLVNPVLMLKTKMAIAWAGCSIGGAILAGYGGHPYAVEAGKVVLTMCAGYMFFGFGIEPDRASSKPHHSASSKG